VEKHKAQKIMDFHFDRAVFIGSGISMDFEVIRYVLISLIDFGHNMGTSPKLRGYKTLFPSSLAGSLFLISSRAAPAANGVLFSHGLDRP